MEEGESTILEMGKVIDYVVHHPSANGSTDQSYQYILRGYPRIDYPKDMVLRHMHKFVGHRTDKLAFCTSGAPQSEDESLKTLVGSQVQDTVDGVVTL